MPIDFMTSTTCWSKADRQPRPRSSARIWSTAFSSRAPIIVGDGKSSFGYVGLDAIADAHGRWRFVDEQRLGVDRLEVYERVRRD